MSGPAPHPGAEPGEAIFTFSRTAAAVKGEAALEAGGLAVKVMPRPPALGEGCGLCLRLPAAEAAEGLRLLAAAGLEPQGVYDHGFTPLRPNPSGPQA